MSAAEELSPLEKLSLLPAAEREELFAEEARKHGRSVDGQKKLLLGSWEFLARPKQLAPAGEWTFWWVNAGRGFGKTLTGAEWAKARGLEGRCRIALVAPTLGDVRSTMVEGETGLLSVLPNDALLGQSREIAWNKTLLQLTLANGTIMQGFSSEVPDRLRGPQHHYAWLEEVSSFNDANSHDPLNSTWSNLKLGLRLGDQPRAVLTSTPKANRLTRELAAMAATGDGVLVAVRGSSYENRANLSEAWWRAVIAPLEGTRTGRQEIMAELLEDVEGALWTRSMIDALRVVEAPTLKRVVVGVDPNTSSRETADDAGVIVVGEGYERDEKGNRHAFVLEDRTTTRGGPAAWAVAAVRAYHDHEGDRVVAEKNNGGEMVSLTIAGVDSTVPVVLVSASRGKMTRAEPVAALYSPIEGVRGPLVHHVGALAELEDEMTTYTGEGDSPNRMDALVWALWWLKLWRPTTRHRGGLAKGRLPGTEMGSGLGDLASPRTT